MSNTVYPAKFLSVSAGDQVRLQSIMINTPHKNKT